MQRITSVEYSDADGMSASYSSHHGPVTIMEEGAEKLSESEVGEYWTKAVPSGYDSITILLSSELW